MFGVLFGFFLLLCLPFVGRIVSHIIHHFLVHRFLEPHETAFIVALTALFWLCVVGAPLALVFGFYWTAANLAMFLIILFRLFGGLGRSH